MNPNRTRLLALSLLLAAGCGGGGVSSSGTVTFGGSPVEDGTILFVHSETGATARDEISGGSYRISGEGLTPGTYRVQISSVQPTGRTVPDADDPDAMIEEVADIIPPRYNRDTELTVELSSGANTHDFALEADPGASPNP